MPIRWVDIPIDAGSTFGPAPATWLAGGVPPSFVGATARLQASVLKSDPAPVFQVTTTPSALGSLVMTTGTPVSGSTPAVPSQIVVTLTPACTSLVVTDLEYDLVITWADGSETTFLAGHLRLRLPVP